MAKEISYKETLHCLYCDYTCSKPAMLKRHNIKHSTVRRFNCNQCSHVAKTKDHLKVHMQTHEDSKPFACPDCEYSCKRQSYLKQHMLTHGGQERQRHLISCIHKNCNYQTIHKSALLQHVKRTHSEEKTFHCSLCEYSGKHPQSLKSHMIRNHRNDKGREPLMKMCTFPNCNYKTVFSHALLRHKRSHSDQKPFSCNACEMSFKQKRFLKQHERYCGGKKKKYLTCLFFNCGYQTVSLRMLKKHLKLVHRRKYKNEYDSEDNDEKGSFDWDSQLSPLAPEVSLQTPPSPTIPSPSISMEFPVHLVVSGSVASPQKTSSAAKSPAATCASLKTHSPAISIGTGMSPQKPFEEIPTDLTMEVDTIGDEVPFQKDESPTSTQPFDLSLKVARVAFTEDKNCRNCLHEKEHWSVCAPMKPLDLSCKSENNYGRKELESLVLEPLDLRTQIRDLRKESRVDEVVTDCEDDQDPTVDLEESESETDITDVTPIVYNCRVCCYQSESNKSIALHNAEVHDVPVVVLTLKRWPCQ